MSVAEEMTELTRLMDAVRRKAKDEDLVDFCDRVLRLIQRVSMTARGVELDIQEKHLEPLPRERV